MLGRDICGGAVTGSGKTAAFTIPILERLLHRPKQNPATRVIILCPTRELAIQCHGVATKLAAFTDIQFSLCVGGLNIRAQEAELLKRPDVVIATPGRLIDHVRNCRAFTLSELEILVIDEADRMLEDGFKDELTEIIRQCPLKRQTMLFSATMTDNVDELIRLSLQKPVRIMVDSNKSTAQNLTQEFVRIRLHREQDRAAYLVGLCRKVAKYRCLIFFQHKAMCHEMNIIFGLLGLKAAELHGNLSQERRIDALERFREGKVDFLMCTDLAARGLDIKGVDTVINFNMPTAYAQYVHRIGRTARAGRTGKAISLAGENDRKVLRQAMKNVPSADLIQYRVLPKTLIEECKFAVDTLKDRVVEVMKEEKEDRVLKQAEMEVKKAENMIKHGDEIAARPARTWFQSEREKRESKSKNLSVNIANVVLDKQKKDDKSELPKRVLPPGAGMSRKKRRRMAFEAEDKTIAKEIAASVRSAKKEVKHKGISSLKTATSKTSTKKKLNKSTSNNAAGRFSFDLTERSNKGAGAKRKMIK